MYQKSLAIILLVASILRLVWLLAFWDYPFRADESEYWQLAQAIWQGGYTDNGRWLRPPLFPLWLAGVSGGGSSLLLARLAQVAAGTLLVYLLYRVARHMWQDERIALLSGLLGALYLPLIGYANYLMAETLLLIFLCGVVLALLQLMQTAAWRWAALVGLLFGLALLTKPIALASIPALLAAYAMTNTIWRRRVQLAALTLVCTGTVLAPWTIHNALVYHRFIPIDTTSGFNLWFGNLPPAEQQTLSSVQQEMQERYPNLADRNAAYQDKALATIRQDPTTFLALLGSKARQLWQLETDALVKQHDIDLTLACPRSNAQPKAVITGEAFGSIQPACWWQMGNSLSDGVFLVMLIGVLVGLFWLPRSPQVTIVWLWVLAFAGAMVLTVVQTRLRLVFLPVIIPFAAAGLMQLFQSYQRQIRESHNSSSTALWSKLRSWRVGATLLAFIVGVWAMRLVPLVVSQGYGMVGTYAWHQGKPAEAWEAYQTAVSWYPERTDVLVQAGQVAETLGYDIAAYRLYEQAINMVYYQAQARVGAARVLLRQGDTAGAAALIEGAILSQGQVERISFAASLLPPQYHNDIGGHAVAEYGYVLGFYPTSPRTPSPDSPTFRWSQERAGIQFGTLPTSEAIVGMRLSTTRPGDDPIPRVGLFVNGRYLTHIPVVPGWWRTYRFVVPATAHGVTLTMHTDTIESQAVSDADQSQRNLGVAIDWAMLYLVDEPLAD
jgi:4-amino-4-deoxy-L-arabinose transferase-like glycosyltransferase